jgi:Fic-DOC domain mobile mystery protein B
MELSMTDVFDEPDDATPLALEERNGLLLSWITFRHELNVAEQENITAGSAWAFRQRRRDILTPTFVKALHKRMFGDVWSWAGNYRRTERNIGITAFRIPSELPMAFDDIRYWVENTTFPADEIAVRLHHKLVAIHPFPNGNGRCSRLMGDLLAVQLKQAPFTWGRQNLTDTSETRRRYITALRAADASDLTPLVEFARS